MPMSAVWQAKWSKEYVSNVSPADSSESEALLVTEAEFSTKSPDDKKQRNLKCFEN